MGAHILASRTWPASANRSPRNARQGAARRKSACRSISTRTTPAASTPPPCSPPAPPAWTSSISPSPRCPARPASRTSTPSPPRSNHTRATPASTSARSTSSPTTGSTCALLRAVRHRAPDRQRRGVRARDARRPIHQPQGAGQRHGPRPPLARNRPHLRRGEPALRRHRQGHPEQQSRRRHDHVPRSPAASSFPGRCVRRARSTSDGPKGGLGNRKPLTGRRFEAVPRNSKSSATTCSDPADPLQVGAPIPGVISTINAGVGTKVASGDKLFTLEAMKMQTTIYAPCDGVVAEVLAGAGETVETKDLVIQLRKA
jgi:biotin carboxyl carrier protein